jgi:hypothetical protein
MSPASPRDRCFAPSPAGACGLIGEAVTLIVSKRACLAGLEPAAFAGHSLRFGSITEGGRRNFSILQLMELSGHADMQTIKGYYQAGSVMANPADRKKGIDKVNKNTLYNLSRAF